MVDCRDTAMSERHESVDLVPDATVAHVASAALLAALTAVLAYVSIPVPGIAVPFSLQPFAVFFAGLLLGPVWGGFALLLYVLVGLAGVPVFSNGGAGIGYFLGPTGGFLVGFLLAAVLVGAVVHRSVDPRDPREASVVTLAVALGAALVAIYAVGVPWLAWAQGIPVGAAAGVMAPFVPPDVLKAALTVAAVAGGDELLSRVG
jgi:biotin transport system substrate-specific component